MGFCWLKLNEIAACILTQEFCSEKNTKYNPKNSILLLGLQLFWPNQALLESVPPLLMWRTAYSHREQAVSSTGYQWWLKNGSWFAGRKSMNINWWRLTVSNREQSPLYQAEGNHQMLSPDRVLIRRQKFRYANYVNHAVSRPNYSARVIWFPHDIRCLASWNKNQQMRGMKQMMNRKTGDSHKVERTHSLSFYMW